jgi:predicted small secreted protein
MMKEIIRRLVTFRISGTCLSLCCALLTGCATTKGYFVDRGRDAADVFTATVGVGWGATARASVLHFGVGGTADCVGLRSGQVQFIPQHFPPYSGTFDPFLTWYMEWQGFMFYNDELYDWGDQLTLERRGKSYRAEGQMPFVALPEFHPKAGPIAKKYPLYYLTQIEVVAGLGCTFRLGFNPGELLDFILGWTTIDIFKDDIGIEKKSNQSSEATPKLGAPQ